MRRRHSCNESHRPSGHSGNHSSTVLEIYSSYVSVGRPARSTGLEYRDYGSSPFCSMKRHLGDRNQPEGYHLDMLLGNINILYGQIGWN